MEKTTRFGSLGRLARRASAAAVAFMVLPVAFAGGASAATVASPSTVADNLNNGFDSIGTLVLTVIGVAFFTLLVTIIGIKVGGKWLARAANK